MLNPTRNRKNRGITRISATPSDIARPPKTRSEKRFAGKTRAHNTGKAGLRDALWRKASRLRGSVSGKKCQMSTLLDRKALVAAMLSNMLKPRRWAVNLDIESRCGNTDWLIIVRSTVRRAELARGVAPQGRMAGRGADA